MSANVAKVAVRYRILPPAGGDPELDGIVFGVLTFHAMKLDSAEPFSAAEVESLAVRVYEWLAADPYEGAPDVGWLPMRAYFLPNFEWLAIEVRPVAPFYEDVTSFPVNLGGFESGVPTREPQLCYLLGLRTTLESRRGRGRIFFPARQSDFGGASHGLVDDSNQQLVGRWGAHLARRIRADELNPDMFLAVYSRVNETARAVTHFEVPNRVTTQRPRAIRPLLYRTEGLSGGFV